MKTFLLLSFFTLISFFEKEKADFVNGQESQASYTTDTLEVADEPKRNEELFLLNYDAKSKRYSIKPLQSAKEEYADFKQGATLYKALDLNGDKKNDLILNFGQPGTGGALFGIFIKQKGKVYKLAFMDYLKNIQFSKAKNGSVLIKSSEEIEAYDPSKVQYTIFKFDSKNLIYQLDTSYIFLDTAN